MKDKGSKIIALFIAAPIFISIYAYIIDCILNFEYAIKNLNYIPLYIMQYLMIRSWLILIIFIIYPILFKKLTTKKFILLKFFFALILSALYSHYFYMDDYSLIIGNMKPLRLFLACSFGSITTICIYEFYLKDKLRLK